MQDYVRREDEYKKQIEAISAENKKNEERVVKAFKKLKAHEAQVEKVQKALEIAMTLSRGDGSNGKPSPAAKSGVPRTTPEPE
jgi:hypothetical protein